MIGSEYFIMYEIIVVLSVYIICTVIEIIRVKLIERPLFDIVLKKIQK